MKFLIVASFCVAVVLAQTRHPAKPVERKLPADVLRDFPGACFASTACRIFQVGETWPLAPFCGNATCTTEGSQLIEVVQDCGLIPKQSEGCRIVNDADRESAFPACCPVYECQDGFTLQYPTPEEIEAAVKATQAQQAGQGNQAAQTGTA